MKKILLSASILLTTLSFNSASAQTFLTSGTDTVWNTISTNGMAEVHNHIKATGSTPIKLNWHIDGYYFAPKMGTEGFCDNASCRDSIAIMTTGAMFQSDYYDNTAFSDFHATFHDFGATNGAVSWIAVSATSGATTRRLVFMVNKVSTSVPTATPSDVNVTLFPNPARDFLNVLYDAKSNVKSIAIYNLIGKTIQVYKVTDNASARLDLDNIPAGVYFIRLMNAQGQIVSTRRFTRQ